MIKVPYTPRKKPPVEVPAPVKPINISGIDEPIEGQVKKVLCKFIDWAIEQLLKLKARLRAPLKAADMEEIEEEEGP